MRDRSDPVRPNVEVKSSPFFPKVAVLPLKWCLSNSQPKSPYKWATFVSRFGTDNFKNCPIWSHWARTYATVNFGIFCHRIWVKCRVCTRRFGTTYLPTYPPTYLPTYLPTLCNLYCDKTMFILGCFLASKGWTCLQQNNVNNKQGLFFKSRMTWFE